jgi:hypothetical protein
MNFSRIKQTSMRPACWDRERMIFLCEGLPWIPHAYSSWQRLQKTKTRAIQTIPPAQRVVPCQTDEDAAVTALWMRSCRDRQMSRLAIRTWKGVEWAVPTCGPETVCKCQCPIRLQALMGKDLVFFNPPQEMAQCWTWNMKPSQPPLECCTPLTRARLSRCPGAL